MKYFIAGEKHYVKLAEVVLVLAILLAALYAYDRNKDFLKSFHIYYLKSYFQAWKFKKENISVPQEGEAKSVPVLTYHGAIGGSDGYNIKSDDFNEQMYALKKAGWQTVTLEDFNLFVQGEKTLPDKSFLLTFDDGRKDSYYPVDPILKSLGYNAVIFVITKHSLEGDESKYYLSKNELEKMIESGRWNVQVHTREGHNLYAINGNGDKGHFYSNKLWFEDENRLETTEEFTDRIRSDFLRAKNDIESKLRIAVLGFAFPFGDYGQDSVNFPESKSIVLDVIKTIYPMSFYQVRQDSGYTFNYPNPDAFLVKRIEVKMDWSPERLLTILNAAREKELPFRDEFKGYMGWIKSWGRMDLVDNKLFFGAQNNSTGGLVFLDGTYQWGDYRVDATVDFLRGQTFSLLSRYQDNENYISCVYTPEYVRLVRVVGGKQELISDTKSGVGIIGSEKNIGMVVSGNNAGCFANGETLVWKEELSDIPKYGGIGFGSWDPEKNNSEMSIRSVIVE